MGTLTSATSLLGQIGRLAGGINSVYGAYNTAMKLTGNSREKQDLRAQQDLAMQQLIASQNSAMQSATERDAAERARIAGDAQDSETARRAALKRAMARQRVQYGAAGLSATDGSGEAVLLGLFEESDQERAGRERLDSMRTQALDMDMADRNRINVLQRTQLQERQKLEKMLF